VKFEHARGLVLPALVAQVQVSKVEGLVLSRSPERSKGSVEGLARRAEDRLKQRNSEANSCISIYFKYSRNERGSKGGKEGDVMG